MNDLYKRTTSWLFKDENDKVVLAQFPNWQLAGAMVAWLVQFVISDGIFHDVARVIFIVFIIFWAYEEIAHGVNGFRRILGLGVLTMISLDLYRTLEVV